MYGTGKASSNLSEVSDVVKLKTLARGSCKCKLRLVPTVIGVLCLASEIAAIENGNFS